jgi:galactokinase
LNQQDRIHHLLSYHRRHAGHSPARIFQAPGRVNLLGEHTDYSGGFCMPAALNFNTLVAASSRPVSSGKDSMLRVHSLDFNETAEISLADLADPGKLPEDSHWSSYCFGVAWALALRGVPLIAADLSLTGNVPLGAGLSSSASVEVATATALLGLAAITMPKPEIALACQFAENNYVGAPCGIMDQFISAAGVRGNALAIDTRALTAELAPIPESLRLVVCNSMVRHSVADGGEYAKVRSEVEEAANVMGRQLRDVTLAELVAARSQMSEQAFKRARHVITDSQRVLDGVAALRAGDAAEFGRLMIAAHASFRDDFEASCAECDLLVDLAIALPGCLGSRLTGGGFGGCTVSLVETAHAQHFAQSLRHQYREATNVDPQVFLCEIADGAGELSQ